MLFKTTKIQESEFQSLLQDNHDSVIIAVSPSCHLARQAGECRVAMMYKDYKKTFVLDLDNVVSAHECAIHGIIEAAKRLKVPKPIILLVAGSFGFKKSLKGKGAHPEMWNHAFDIFQSKGCPCITEVFVHQGGNLINTICEKYS